MPGYRTDMCDRTPTKVLHVVYGPPGSGKTTFAKTLGGRLFEVDDFEGLYREDGTMELASLIEAHAWCKTGFKEAVEAGDTCLVHTVIRLDSVNTKYYMLMATESGYKVNIVTPKYGLLFYTNSLSTEDQVLLLIARRGTGTARYVPEDIIRDCCQTLLKHVSYMHRTREYNQIDYSL